jgi:hypothetical protein
VISAEAVLAIKATAAANEIVFIILFLSQLRRTIGTRMGAELSLRRFQPLVPITPLVPQPTIFISQTKLTAFNAVKIG